MDYLREFVFEMYLIHWHISLFMAVTWKFEVFVFIRFLTCSQKISLWKELCISEHHPSKSIFSFAVSKLCFHISNTQSSLTAFFVGFNFISHSFTFKPLDFWLQIRPFICKCHILVLPMFRISPIIRSTESEKMFN